MHFLTSVCSLFIDNFSLECANTFENDYRLRVFEFPLMNRRVEIRIPTFPILHFLENRWDQCKFFLIPKDWIGYESQEKVYIF